MVVLSLLTIVSSDSVSYGRCCRGRNWCKNCSCHFLVIVFFEVTIACSWWRVPNPPILRRLLYYLSPLFVKILSNSPCLQPPTLNPKYLFLPFVSLGEWVIAPHLMCYFTLIWLDNMDLHMSSLGTLVPEGPCCVFYAIRYQVYWNLMHVFFLLVLWFFITTKTHHTQAPKDWHTHIDMCSVMCSQQLCVLNWMDNSLVSKIDFS